jgi:hypothetical protein
MDMQKSRFALVTLLAFCGATARASDFSHDSSWNRHDSRMGNHNQNPTIQADRTALDDDFLQLRGDREAGDITAVSTDQANLTSDAAQLQSDMIILKLNVKDNVAVQADKTAVGNDKAKLWADSIQVRSDIVADNTSATATDKDVLKADRAQLQTDATKMKQDIKAVIALPLR